jgi:hypothetical protein
MAALREESTLYRKLDDMYIAKGDQDISEEFFSECISVATTFSKTEIRFVLFKLKLMNEDVDTGIDRISSLLNSLQKVLNTIMGKNLKKAFIVTVLETALEEVA